MEKHCHSMAGKWIFNRKMKSPYRMHIRYVDILQELKVVVVNVFSGQQEVYRKTSMKRLLAFHPETSVPDGRRRIQMKGMLTACSSFKRLLKL